MITEIEELRTQSETLRAQLRGVLVSLDAAQAEINLLRAEIADRERRHAELDKIIESAAQMVAQQQCAQLKARGVPCHVKADRIYHDITGALLN